MRSEGYSTWSVCLLLNISLFTCLFVPQTIPSRQQVKVENFKRFSLKLLRCEARAFPVDTAYSYMITPQKMCMHMNLNHMASGCFVLGRDVHLFIAACLTKFLMTSMKGCLEAQSLYNNKMYRETYKICKIYM